jgi:hypothetical protein
MSDSSLKASARAKPLRWTIRFAVATWVAAVVLILVFALLWRMFYVPPHAFWAVVTTGALLLAGTLTTVVGVYQIVRGPRRVLAAAIVLVGTTPIVGFAMFFLTLYLKAEYRHPIQFDAPTRLVMMWAESACDLEARWRYSRWTPGQHVVLLDDGRTPQPEQLVERMDEHIERMSDHLGVPVPPGTARWVRGPLLGKHGIALVNWAICDMGEPVGNLTPFDRHETAHVVMARMGDADQSPPMLLAEGWAESQSKDRATLIQSLAQELEQGTNHTLQELIGPMWYGRSASTVYGHGGPLVVYLMEHYGPEKFFSLYHGVRPATFPADCQRILGDPWPVVEDQFWQWLAAEADKIGTEQGEKDGAPNRTTDVVELADSVDPELWQSIVDGYRAARPKRPQMPDPCAFAVEKISTVPEADGESPPGTYEETWRFVVDGERVWQLHSLQPQGRLEAVRAKEDSSASYRVSESSRVTRTHVGRSSHDARLSVRDDWNMFTNFADLGYYLPVEPESRFRGVFRINAIRPPTTAAESLWEVDCVQRLPDGEDEIACHLTFDASADWCVKSFRNATAKERNECRSSLGTFFGHAVAIETSTRSETDQGTWTMQLRLCELSRPEAQAVRDEVEAIARRGPTCDWSDLLLRPMTLAIAWPAIGLLLLGYARVQNGRRISEPEEE